MKPLIAALLTLSLLFAIAVRAADETNKTTETSQTQSTTTTTTSKAVDVNQLIAEKSIPTYGPWQTDFKKAVELSKSLARPLFIMTNMEWSSPDRRQMKLLNGPEISQLLDTRFVKVLASDKALSGELKFLKIERFPTSVILTSDLTELARHEGFEEESNVREHLLKELARFQSWQNTHTPVFYAADADIWSSGLQKAVQSWTAEGLVRREDGAQPPPYAVSITLFDTSSSTSFAPETAILRALSTLDIPPVSFRLSRSPAGSRVQALSARLWVARNTPPEIPRQIVEALTKQGVTSTGDRELGIAVWAIKSDFSSLDSAGTAELKKMLEEIGIARDKIEAAPNIASELLFRPEVALAYEPKAAESLLSWLKSHQMVIEVQSATSANFSWLQVPIVSTDANGGSQPFVKKSYTWQWSVGQASPRRPEGVPDRESSQPATSRLGVTQSLSMQEQWRGDATSRDAKTLVHSNFNFDLKPGMVAIVQAFPAPPGAKSGVAEIYHKNSRNSGSLPLLVIEDPAWDLLPAFELDKPTAEPKAVAPESAAPIEFGSGSTNIAWQSEEQEVASLIRSASRSQTAQSSSTKKKGTEPSSEKSEPLKLIVTDNAGAETDADREQVRKLIEEGILTQHDKNARAIPTSAALLIQPKVSQADWQNAGMALGMGPGSAYAGGPLPTDMRFPPINPAWDASIRRLSWALRNRTGGLLADHLYVGLIKEPRQPEADAALTLPETSPDELADLVLAAFGQSNLVVNVVREHPVFGTVHWVKGHGTFAVYANETGSPTRLLKGGPNETVDIRIADGSARLPAWLPRPAILLEKQKVQILTDSRKSSGQSRIVGIDVTPEEADLLRAAERRFTLEAIRRDPQDTSTQITPDSARKLREVLNASATPPAKTEVALGPVSDRATTARPQVSPNVAEAATTVPAATTPTFKIFKLYNADAVSQAHLLSQVIHHIGFSAVADARTNSIIVTAPDEDTSILAEAILAKLDSEPAKPRVAIARAGASSGSPVVRGTPAKSPADLQQTYNDREAAAARLAKQLRDLAAAPQTSGKPAPRAEEQTRLTKELSEAVKKSFEARQEMLKAELDNLQSRIAETQKSLDNRDQAADTIIERRVQDLLNPEFKWDEPAPKTVDAFGATAAATASNPFAAPTPYGAPAPTFAAPSPSYAPPPAPLANPQAPPASPTYAPRNPAASRSEGGSGSSPTGKPRLRTMNPSGLGSDVFKMLTELGLEFKTTTHGAIEFQATDEQFNVFLRRFMDLKMAADAEQREETRLQLLEGLTGVWQATGQQANSPKLPDLVIDHDQAAYFSGREVTRRWQVDVVGPLKTEPRVQFDPQDGKAAMEALLERDGFQGTTTLRFVNVGPEGLTTTVYKRAFTLVPSEWSAKLHEGEKTPPTADKPVSDQFRARGGWSRSSSSSPFGGGFSGAGFTSSASAPARAEPRNPSDYLELLQKYQTDSVNYELVATMVGKDHPDARKLQADRERQLKAVAVIRQEFQTELDNAARTLQLKKEVLGQATETLARVKQLLESARATPSELDTQRLATDSARAEMETAEARLKLFQSTRDSLFPPSSPESSIPTLPPSTATGVAPLNNPPAPPADTTSPPTNPATSNFSSDLWRRSDQPRQPSDFLELLQKYQAVVADDDRRLKRISQDDPAISKLHTVREQHLKPIAIIQQEFQLELDNAARAVALKSVALSDAKTAFDNSTQLANKGGISRRELSKYENAVKSAEIELQNAEARFKLFQSTKDSLFPTSTPDKSTLQPGHSEKGPSTIPESGPNAIPSIPPIGPAATAPASPPAAPGAPAAPAATPSPPADPKTPGAPSPASNLN